MPRASSVNETGGHTGLTPPTPCRAKNKILEPSVSSLFLPDLELMGRNVLGPTISAQRLECQGGKVGILAF
jgi:hypothetical protein